MNNEKITYFTINTKTVFIPLKYLYPECVTLIEKHPQMFPLKCLKEDGCPVNIGCMDILVRRLHYLFDNVMKDTELVLAYFKYSDTKSLRAGVFFKDTKILPRVIVVNPYGFKKLQNEGTVYQWQPTNDYINIAPTSNIIPSSQLLKCQQK